jgi:hypothetical protein
VPDVEEPVLHTVLAILSVLGRVRGVHVAKRAAERMVTLQSLVLLVLLRQTGATGRVRLSFDASAAAKTGMSLADPPRER